MGHATTPLDGWAEGFSENRAISARTKVEVGSKAFLESNYQITHLCFCKGSCLMPESACLDEYIARFPEDVGIPTNLKICWVLCIFWCQLIKVNPFAFDENHVFRH